MDECQVRPYRNDCAMFHLPQQHHSHRQTAHTCAEHEYLRGLSRYVHMVECAVWTTQATTAQCSTCHNNTTAPGKPATHIASTNTCDDCHVTSNWANVSFDHSKRHRRLFKLSQWNDGDGQAARPTFRAQIPARTAMSHPHGRMCALTIRRQRRNVRPAITERRQPAKLQPISLPAMSAMTAM